MKETEGIGLGKSIADIVRMVGAPEDKKLAKVLANPTLKRQLAGTIMVEFIKAGGIFRPPIDDGAPLTEMISRCKFRKVDYLINAENFSDSPVFGQQEMTLFLFNRKVTTLQAETRIVRRGWQPGNLRNLLSFSVDLFLRKDFVIVALGNDADNQLVSYFCDRRLEAMPNNGLWFKNIAFLGVRGVQKAS